MTKNPEHRIPLRALDRVFRETAESWWFLSLFFKLSIFIAGLFLIFLPAYSQIIPFVVIALTLVAEFSSWQYHGARDAWETLHRKLDLAESLGWEISNAEISDLLTQSTKKQKEQALRLNLEEYFASDKDIGAKRTLENVQESAWWAKHLARRAANIYIGVIILLLIGSFAVLIVSIETIRDFDVLTNMGRAATSAVMLIFSLDIARTANAYHKYSEKAASIESESLRLLKTPHIKPLDAIKIMQDYHLAHAEAPMNPQWLWKLMRDELNRTWQEYRR
jgi:hypothetical protein